MFLVYFQRNSDVPIWRGAGAVELATLERWYTGNGIVGSAPKAHPPPAENPTPIKNDGSCSASTSCGVTNCRSVILVAPKMQKVVSLNTTTEEIDSPREEFLGA